MLAWKEKKQEQRQCGDFNFIFYENNHRYEGFYTFPTVYLKQSDGSIGELPAYQNGNYLDNDNQLDNI